MNRSYYRPSKYLQREAKSIPADNQNTAKDYDDGQVSLESRASYYLTDMGVNVIELGMTDDDIVASACKKEIQRRIKRYALEIKDGNETPETLARTRQYSVEASPKAS